MTHFQRVPIHTMARKWLRLFTMHKEKRGTWHKGIMEQRKLNDTMKHKNMNEKKNNNHERK